MSRRPFLLGAFAAGVLTFASAANAESYDFEQRFMSRADLARVYTKRDNGQQIWRDAVHSFSPTGNGVRVSTQASATIGGRTVPLTLISRMPVPTVATAARGVAMLNPASAAVTILGFAAMNHWLEQAELGWNMDPATNRSMPFTKKVEDEIAGCILGEPRYSTWQAYAGTRTSSDWVITTTLNTWVEGSNCRFGYTEVHHSALQGRTLTFGPIGAYTVPKDPQAIIVDVPVSWGEGEGKLNSVPPSAVDWAALIPQLIGLGGTFDKPVDRQLSGPTELSGERKSRELGGGKKEITETKTQLSYDGPKVTVTTTTTTTTVDENGNPDPNIPPVTETTENPDTPPAEKLEELIKGIEAQREKDREREREQDKQEREEDFKFQDVPFAEVPDFYTPRYPDGMAGVWATHKGALAGTALGAFASKLMPSGLGSGSCPEWSVNLDVGIFDGGVHDVSIPCGLWQTCKVLILIGALLLARRLVFGG